MRQFFSLSKAFLPVSLILLSLNSSGQLVQVVVEEFDPSTLNPNWSAISEANNLTTYRIYAEMGSPSDKVVELTAHEQVIDLVSYPCVETFISTTTSWYNSTLGGALGSQIDPALLGVMAELAGDSWLTIGMDNISASGQVLTAGMSGLDASFNTPNGVNLHETDGSVFSLPTLPNVMPVGPSNRVLLGQLTTDGAISFGINVSVQLGGMPGTAPTVYTNGTCSVTAPGGSLNYIPGADLGCLYVQPNSAIVGCTDPGACNYNPEATVNTGVCDFVACAGCTDPAAENFDANAEIDDDSCIYDCSDNNAYVIVETVAQASDIGWMVITEAGEVVAAGGFYENSSTIFESFCLANGCYSLEIVDVTSLGWSGADFALIVPSVGLLITSDMFAPNSSTYSFSVNASCDGVIAGCTDPFAVNWNPEASIDDGSCNYSGEAPPNDECSDANSVACGDVIVTSTIGAMGLGETCPNIVTPSTCSVAPPADVDTSALCYTLVVDYDAFCCEVIWDDVCQAAYDDCTDDCSGASSMWYTVEGTGDNIHLSTCGSFTATTLNVGVLPEGCSGELTGVEQIPHPVVCGINFGENDGLSFYGELGTVYYVQVIIQQQGQLVLEVSCSSFAAGCTDPAASNYDSSAANDDGSCIYPGCTDSEAMNYNPQANVDDGSCVYSQNGPQVNNNYDPMELFVLNSPDGNVNLDIFNANGSEALSVFVFDVHGRIVATREFGTGNERVRMPIEAQRFASGVYLINVFNGTNRLTERFMRQ
ncbi:MAG: T9SS type A sorting domain-containing protein [Flavobacteriales bacterium]